MKKTGFKEKPIAVTLRQAETGTRVEEIYITGDFFNLIKK